jgi:hypothetical protein
MNRYVLACASETERSSLLLKLKSLRLRKPSEDDDVGPQPSLQPKTDSSKKVALSGDSSKKVALSGTTIFSKSSKCCVVIYNAIVVLCRMDELTCTGKHGL